MLPETPATSLPSVTPLPVSHLHSELAVLLPHRADSSRAPKQGGHGPRAAAPGHSGPWNQAHPQTDELFVFGEDLGKHPGVSLSLRVGRAVLMKSRSYTWKDRVSPCQRLKQAQTEQKASDNLGRSICCVSNTKNINIRNTYRNIIKKVQETTKSQKRREKRPSARAQVTCETSEVW